MKKMLKGFTLVEIMIVVAIIAILAAVAIPNFIKYRNDSQRSSCISNMKQLQTAGEQFLIANGAGQAPSLDDLCGSDKYIKNTPTCPYAGATYEIGKDATTDAITVTCGSGREGHELPNG